MIEFEDVEHTRYVGSLNARCDVIIPHYGSEKKLERCLHELEPYMDFVHHIVVIDNNKHNRGFTRAINSGIMMTESDYLLLLNNDCYAYIDPLRPLLERMEESPRCGMVCPMTLAEHKPDWIIHAGGVDPNPGTHRMGSVKLGDCRYPTKVRWASFAVVLLRRMMVVEIGLLDNRFFHICSDTDYSYTARSRGWEIWYEPRSRWLHESSASFTSDILRPIVLSDRRKFIDKWMNGRLYEELNFEVFEEMTGNGKTMDTAGYPPTRRIKTIAESEKGQEDTPEGPAQGGEEGWQARQTGEAGDHLEEVSKT